MAGNDTTGMRTGKLPTSVTKPAGSRGGTEEAGNLNESKKSGQKWPKSIQIKRLKFYNLLKA